MVKNKFFIIYLGKKRVKMKKLKIMIKKKNLNLMTKFQIKI